MAEPGLRIVALAAHVPFADESGVVAGTLEVLREKCRAGRHRTLIVHNAMPVSVLPGENTRTARRTQRRRDERVPEVHTILRERIQIWCFQERMAHEAEGVVPMIVGQHDDDVARRVPRTLTGLRGGWPE